MLKDKNDGIAKSSFSDFVVDVSLLAAIFLLRDVNKAVSIAYNTFRCCFHAMGNIDASTLIFILEKLENAFVIFS